MWQKMTMVVSIVRCCFQGLGWLSKTRNLPVSNKNSKNIRKRLGWYIYGWDTAFRVHLHIPQKDNLTWFGPKSEKKQDKNDYSCQGPSDRSSGG